MCVCDQKQEEQKPGAEPADMEGETLIAMVTKAVTAIIGRLQSELPLCVCAWMNVCSFFLSLVPLFFPKATNLFALQPTGQVVAGTGQTCSKPV